MHGSAMQAVQDAPDAADASEDGKRPTGRIVGIIRRNWRTRGYCGSLKPGQHGGAHTAAVLFVPVERRFPMIRVHTRQVSARPLNPPCIWSPRLRLQSCVTLLSQHATVALRQAGSASNVRWMQPDARVCSFMTGLDAHT